MGECDISRMTLGTGEILGAYVCATSVETTEPYLLISRPLNQILNLAGFTSLVSQVFSAIESV